MADNHIHTLLRTLGEGFFLEELGFSERNLRHAKSVGKISAQYFDAVEKACLDKGLECPRDAFAWKDIAKNSGDGQPVQVSGG